MTEHSLLNFYSLQKDKIISTVMTPAICYILDMFLDNKKDLINTGLKLYPLLSFYFSSLGSEGLLSKCDLSSLATLLGALSPFVPFHIGNDIWKHAGTFIDTLVSYDDSPGDAPHDIIKSILGLFIDKCPKLRSSINDTTYQKIIASKGVITQERRDQMEQTVAKINLLNDREDGDTPPDLKSQGNLSAKSVRPADENKIESS